MQARGTFNLIVRGEKQGNIFEGICQGLKDTEDNKVVKLTSKISVALEHQSELRSNLRAQHQAREDFTDEFYHRSQHTTHMINITSYQASLISW